MVLLDVERDVSDNERVSPGGEMKGDSAGLDNDGNRGSIDPWIYDMRSVYLSQIKKNALSVSGIHSPQG